MTPEELGHHILLDFLSTHDTGGARTAYFVRLPVIILTPGELGQQISLDFLTVHDAGGARTAYFVRLVN